MKRLSNIDIFHGQMLLSGAVRHIANRAGSYTDETLRLPKAEGEAVCILNQQWQELEINRKVLARWRTQRARRRKSRRGKSA